MRMANLPASRADFIIAIICALPVEATAVWPLFEVIYSGYQHRNLLKVPDDDNTYTLGRIGEYDVILAHMPCPGKKTASAVAVHLKRTYTGIKLAFLLGVCGAVPLAQNIHHPPGSGADIFLGDVIVSHGVVEYDFGTRSPGGFVRKDTLTFSQGRAGQGIRSIIAMMKASQEKLEKNLSRHLALIQEKQDATYPGLDKDILWQSTYEHCLMGCQCSLNVADIDHSVVSRCRTPDVKTPLPRLHFGIIASGDTVVKSATYHDQVAARDGVIGYEMELTGVWDSLPCILIKGVADYADSHKSKDWQEYAAASSAACMRALLDLTPIPFKSTESGPSEGKQS
ncbi:nucleoside phosphorylase domain-containing protein [Aspergillus granulosus]|uniref:Nucleoside phosphorylase domain-containing protein n=1 Tax=Aspergillus granulosus TaxID=176169 RepID=A0ABR4HKT5_9EURO